MHAVRHVVTHPSYAAVYVDSLTHRREHLADDRGRTRDQTRHVGRCQWRVLIADPRPGHIDWATFEANQAPIGANIRPRADEPSGALREGRALFRGLATCERRLTVHHKGSGSTLSYHYARRELPAD